jgi:pyrophosphate--fructose-6-phosphate 1-phosphotransferase
METRKGKLKPVVSKSLVDITAPAFREFEKHRDEWAVNTDYRFPGPIQYYGPPSVSDRITETLRLDSTR